MPPGTPHNTAANTSSRTNHACWSVLTLITPRAVSLADLLSAGHVRNTAWRQRPQREKTDERGEIRHVSSQRERDNPPLPHSPLTSDTNLHSTLTQSRALNTKETDLCACTHWDIGGWEEVKQHPRCFPPHPPPHAVEVRGQTKMVGSPPSQALVSALS